MNRFIYGAGGHGKVVLDAMQRANLKCVAFIDDRDLGAVAGLNVTNTATLSNTKDALIHLAIGNCKTRESLANALKHHGFFSVFHPAAIIAASSKIGDGTLVTALSIVGPDAIVGRHCIINHAAVIDHDCEIADFAHIAPHVALGGGVRVGRGALIGSGAVVLPGVQVGDYAVVGAGAVVTQNVVAGTTVIGAPARIYNN